MIFCLCKMFLSPFFAGVCFTLCLEFFGEKNVVILFHFVVVIEYSLISFSFLLCLFSIRLKRFGECVVYPLEDGLIGDSYTNNEESLIAQVLKSGREIDKAGAPSGQFLTTRNSLKIPPPSSPIVPRSFNFSFSTS